MIDVMVYQGDLGVPLDYTAVDETGAVINLQSATEKQYTIVRPDGSSEEVDATFITNGSDGKLRYVLDEVDQVGIWKYRAFYTTPLGTYHGAWLEFYAGEPSPIEATWGGTAANCYLSLVEANAFITSSILDSSAWTDATEAQRVAALLEATRDIDAFEYLGMRYFADQMLEFPREFRAKWPWNRVQLAITTESIEQQRMKKAVQNACCQQALWLLRQGGRDMHRERIASGVRSYSEVIGESEESFSYFPSASGSKLSSEAASILKQYRGQKTVFRG
jgi:hypothetical protein